MRGGREGTVCVYLEAFSLFYDMCGITQLNPTAAREVTCFSSVVLVGGVRGYIACYSATYFHDEY